MFSRIYASVMHVKTQYTSLLKGESSLKYGFSRDPENVVDFLETFYDETNVLPQEVEYVEAFGSG